MREYREAELLRLAKRHHNTKRRYLMVNPLQGKHIPVSPSACLAMLRTLGEKLAAAAPQIDLVIGFAETATAVGAVVAECLGAGCVYAHTTREDFLRSPDAVFFQEEHSHATDQYLCMADFRAVLGRARAVAFVDDEISTGKTLMNIIRALRASCPELKEKPVWVASIINRLNAEQRALLRNEGISDCSLLKLPQTDYTSAVERYAIREADAPEPAELPVKHIALPPTTADPRRGVDMVLWRAQCKQLAEALIAELKHTLAGKTVTVLGTEEYMYPGLMLGEALEKAGCCASVRFHATTRSPIGLCTDADYPIRSGFRLTSFYESGRTTYIYNLQAADAALILTDSPEDGAAEAGLRELAAALRQSGCGEIICIREASHVQ